MIHSPGTRLAASQCATVDARMRAGSQNLRVLR
jgi:hypothetical protein